MTAPRSDTATPTRSWLRWSWQPHDRQRLITALAVAGVVAAGLMALLGLPPVDLHGPLHYLGIMDPSCGGTRAARYTLRGEWAQAWRYNPLGIIAVAAAVIVAGRAVVGAVARRWFTITISWTPGRRRLVLAVAIIALVVLEVRQQMLASLLTATG